MQLKSKMTFDEMARHLVATTGKIANRVSVGKHAKALGYKVYKPMINGKIIHFYLKVDKQDAQTEN
jgi:hypothetical protein